VILGQDYNCAYTEEALEVAKNRFYVSLREHFESLFREKEKRDEQRFRAQEAAAALALTSTREALTIALATVKDTSNARIEANKLLNEQTEKFAEQRLEVHNNIRPWIESLIAGQSTKIETLEQRISRFENREEGIKLSTKLIVGLIGFIATLIGIVGGAVGLYFAFHK
jgi:hypothetical protein